MTDPVLDSLENLARGKSSDLLACLTKTTAAEVIDGTRCTAHCYHVKLDGNGRPLVSDLIRAVSDAVLDYAIPREQISAARQRLEQTGAADSFSRLVKEARALFTDAANSGEVGELLLFLFAERVLRLPQLFSKMFLKTTTRKHYEGSDGIHAGATEDGKLALYWGESKIYSDVTQAITRCFKDLATYLHRDNGHDERDLQLLRQYVDIGALDLENAILSYFDPNSPDFRSAEYRGLAMVGFSSEAYAERTQPLTPEVLLERLTKERPAWPLHVAKRVNEEALLTFVMHTFLLPFPDAESFRLLFKEQLGMEHGD